MSGSEPIADPDQPPDRGAAPSPTDAFGIFRNSILVTLGQGSVAVLFVTYIFAARILGDAAYGEFSLGLTIAVILVILPIWGSRRYSAIVTARDPRRTEEYLATNLGLTCALAWIYFPLIALTGHLLTGNPAVVWAGIFLGADQLAREFGLTIRSLFRVHDLYRFETITVFAERGAIVVLAAVALVLFPDPVVLAAAFACGRIAGSMVTAFVFRRHVGRIRVKFELDAMRELFRNGTPIALRRGVNLVTFRVDLLFLGGIRSAQEVGWYGSIYTLMDGFVMIPNSVTGSVGPKISATFGEGRRDVVVRLYQRGLKYLAIFGLFVGGVLGVFSEWIVDLLYGSEYAPAAGALFVLSLSVVFVFLRVLATEVLDNVDLRRASVVIFVLALALNVVLNTLLIPMYGIVGAAAATVATEALLMVGMVRELAWAGYPGQFWRHVGRPALALVAPVALMWWISDVPLVAIPAATIVYAVGLTMLGVWDKKDRDLVHTVRQRLHR